MRLVDYVNKKPGRTQQAWADDFGISRAFFNQLMSGRRNPSLEVMARINTVTRGKVPPASWLERADPPTAPEFIDP